MRPGRSSVSLGLSHRGQRGLIKDETSHLHPARQRVQRQQRARRVPENIEGLRKRRRERKEVVDLPPHVIAGPVSALAPAPAVVRVDRAPRQLRHQSRPRRLHHHGAVDQHNAGPLTRRRPDNSHTVRSGYFNTSRVLVHMCETGALARLGSSRRLTVTSYLTNTLLEPLIEHSQNLDRRPHSQAYDRTDRPVGRFCTRGTTQMPAATVQSLVTSRPPAACSTVLAGGHGR